MIFPDLLKAIFLSFVATLGFGVLLHAPRRALYVAAAIGAFGYLVYFLLLQSSLLSQAAMFISAITASMLAELAARKMGMAATVFSTLSIIPLVPGLSLYRCMALLAQGDSALGLEMGVDAMVHILMIALGMGMGAFLFRALYTSAKSK